MQDLEFTPAIRALAPMLSEMHGGVAAQLLAQFGDDALPTLLAACKSQNPTERLNGVYAFEYGRRSIPSDLLMVLINDESPEVRLHATRCARANWDQRLTDPMVALLRGGGRIRYVGDKRKSLLSVASADLAPLMTNRFGTVRLLGLRAMQNIADATAVDLTLSLLRDTNSVIRSRAFTVVQEITGQNLSESDPAIWEAWWAANQGSFTPRKSAP